MNRINVELEARGVEISGGYGNNPYIFLTLDQVDPEPVMDSITISEFISHFGDSDVLSYFTIQDILAHFGESELLAAMDTQTIMDAL
ncbi:hypothetical protein P19_0172 [Aeromonas phage P19]|uniref:Uncharacterized protein n=1 Tax=Aeromonas phage Asswx_1 TaxID=2419739 RepID=A0A411B8W2_9CAUD|nr:hypothetical protein ASswx1_393 [Aeromonas phage Asswx_1]QAX98924.1 hypothetical protein assk_130 [Aeromonas phage Assk]QMV28901.1 hypothetical protein AP1_0194 [Aeromonas phage AP1]UKM62660.1 hypothetical protein P19_0172 [Aeromonas phage P19]